MTGEPEKKAKEGGIFWGWFVVAGAFAIMSVSYGSKFCFGIFVEPMVADFKWPVSAVSLGASINFFMYAAGGILSGWLLDRMAPRWIMTMGSLITAAGFVLTTFVTTPIELYLTYGVLCGLGASGVGLVVASSSVGKWFVRRRGVAVGIASMGIGFGTMMLAPLAGYIVKYYDWRDGFITFGVLIAVIGVGLSQLLMGKTNPEAYGWRPDGDARGEHSVRSMWEENNAAVSLKPVLADRRFWILVICFSTAIMTEMMAFVHQVNYAVDYGIDKIAAASSIGAIGIASVFGRFFFGWFSDRLSDPKYSACLGFVVMAGGMFILMNTTTVYQLFFYALLFGFGYGSIAPMMPILLADRFGRYILGSVYGWLTFLAVGFGGVFGPIIGGLIYDSFGSYTNAWVLNCGVLLIVAVLIVALRRDDGRLQDQVMNIRNG